MQSNDFSAAPRVANGEFMFFGGTRYSGLWALIRLSVVWPRLARAMRRAPGSMGHFLWYRFPYTFGNFSSWDSWEHMMAFARSSEHRRAMVWLAKPGVGRASFIRFLRARPDGHTIGEWRAEPDPDREWRRFRLPFSSGTVDDIDGWGAITPHSDDDPKESHP